MKKLLNILSIISLIVATYEIINGRKNEAILFTVWSFYLKYLSDNSK